MRVKNGLWMAFASIATAQTVTPSNSSSDLTDPAASPRFYINPSGTTQFPAFLVAPLGRYAAIDRRTFMGISFSGVLMNTNPTTVNQINSNDFNFVSCDPEHYEGGNIDASSMLRIIANQRGSPTSDKSSLIFYSVRSNHCSISDFSSLPLINGIFTTVDPTVASQVANMNFTTTSNAAATLTPDRTAFWQNTSGYSGQPTTAVAMIILYSITGVITALFVIIIITGAIRAHRHPERYGPRASPGQPRQSRAKGIARAMLETLPIVKFGDHTNLPKDKNASAEDIELAHPANNLADGTTTAKVGAKPATITTSAVGDVDDTTSKTKSDAEGFSNADGSDEAGVLGCSICTEDFHKGEEVRVLPCNHKFHPECVDPWLLNVSGTCPLCRISLAPEGEQTQSSPDATNENMPPPLASNPPPGDRRSLAIHNLMAMAYGSRDERLIALRRYRSDRRGRNPSQPQVNEEERISRSRRFREAFRIRTRRHDVNETEAQTRNSGVAAASGGQMRF